MSDPTSVHLVTAVVCGMFGLVVGSFLNVVIYRLPRNLSVVEPRSFCPSCKVTLRSIDNIPVLSWAFLRGRCRNCKVSISPRYPIVEASTAAMFVALALLVGPPGVLPSLLVVVTVTVAISGIDADDLAIPSIVLLIGAFGALSIALPSAILGTWSRLGWGFGAGGIAAAAMLALDQMGVRRGDPRKWGRVVIAIVLCAMGGWLWAPMGFMLCAVPLITVLSWPRLRPSSVRSAPIAVFAGVGLVGLLVAASLGGPS